MFSSPSGMGSCPFLYNLTAQESQVQPVHQLGGFTGYVLLATQLPHLNGKLQSVSLSSRQQENHQGKRSKQKVNGDMKDH